MTTDTSKPDTPTTPTNDSPAAPPASEPSAQHSSAAAPAGEPKAPVVDSPKSAVEHVLKVMDKDRSAAAAAAASGTTTAAAPAAAAPAAPGSPAGPAASPSGEQPSAANGYRLTKEQYDPLPDYAKQRMGWLMSQAKHFQGEFEKVRPQVQGYNELNEWATKHGVTQDDYTFALHAIALSKSNPTKAWEFIQPWIADLRKFVGEELPQDLAQEVEAGTISRERAQELARRRSEAALTDEQRRATAAAEEQRQVAERAKETNVSIVRAIAGYENQWKGSDPDYAKKSKNVSNAYLVKLEERRRAGSPVTSPDEALTLLKEARKEVEDWMSGLMPKPAPTSGMPASGADVRTRTEPKNALEAAKAGLARAGERAAA